MVLSRENAANLHQRRRRRPLQRTWWLGSTACIHIQCNDCVNRAPLPAGGAAAGLSVANLKYLTVANALADLNAGIDHIKAQYGADANAPVVLVGGSYPGGLVGWHRVAFPEKTVFGLASSGVVNPILEYTAFDEAVAKAIEGTCADTLRATTAAFDAAEQAGAASRSASRALFNSPDELSTPDFSYMLADSAAMAVQYGTKAQLCAALQPSSDPQTLM
jgi:hypothetical protein